MESRVKCFGELKAGDYVYAIPDKCLEITEVMVTRITPHYSSGVSFIRLEGERYSRVAYDNCTRIGKSVFITWEEAEKVLRWKVQENHKKLEKQIDQIVSEYDRLNEFLECADETLEVKDPIKFGTVKFGDKIFWINKNDLKVEVAKINRSVKNGVSCYPTLNIYTDRGKFTAYPGSDKSFSNEFYTSSDKAWMGLVKYVRRRVKTVGNKMEKLMIVFNHEEKFLDGRE